MSSIHRLANGDEQAMVARLVERPPRSVFIPSVLIVVGILLQAFVLGPSFVWSFAHDAPLNDFISSYSAAALATDSRLYDPAAVQAFQESHGVMPDQHRMAFLRPPFYALLLTPLRLLDYRHAYLVWQILAVCSFVALGLIWHYLLSDVSVGVVLAWSLPVGYSLLRGQDIHLFLLFYSVGALLLQRRRPYAAGLILSLCLLKWIFLLPLPLLLLAKRLGRTAAGFTAGALVMVVASTIVQGWNWPIAYLETILRPTASPKLFSMPTLRGITYTFDGALTIEAIAAALVLCSFWIVLKKEDRLAAAFAGLLFAGLLVAHHAFLYDAAILAPFLALAVKHERAFIRVTAFILILPVSWIALTFSGWAFVTQALLLLLFFAYSWSVFASAKYSQTSSPQ